MNANSNVVRNTAAAHASIALAVVGITLAFFLARSVASESYRDVVVVAAVAQVLWVGFRWRASVLAFMVYVATEGFIVNFFHAVPELNLLKDFMAVALFATLALALIVNREQAFFPLRPWLVAFLGFAAIYLLQVFNPSLPNLLVGLVGVRATLLFFVLAPVGYWYFDSRERIVHFVEFMVWLSVPVSLFGIAQSYFGPTWVMSLSPGFQRAVFFAFGASGRMENAYFRTFSTFVQTGSFAIFLSLTLLLTVALWVIPGWRSRRSLLIGMFGVQFWAFLTTGGRTPFILLILMISLLLFTYAAARRFIPLILLAPLLFQGLSSVTGLGYQERYSTILDFDYVVQRNAPLVSGWLSQAMETDWVGLGAGYASVASRHVGYTPLNQSVVENALAKIRFEVGVPGLVLYLVFAALAILECYFSPRRGTDPVVRWLATAIGLFVATSICLVVAGTPFEVSPTNTYIWLFLGLLARVPRLSISQPPAVSK